MPTKSLGKVFMTPRGIWSKTNYYQTLDVVMVREATACKGYIATDNIEAICTYLVSFLKEDLYSNLPRKTLLLLHSIESLLKDSDKEIILVHMMSAYFYITQGNKKSSRDIISDY